MAKQTEVGKPGGNRISTEVAVVKFLPSWCGRDRLNGLILVLAVILAYQPVWHAGFVWDDEFYITANPYLLGLSGLEEFWTTSAAEISPLANTTFWVEHALWGLAPLPYHLVNVLLHGACAVVLWRVLRSLQVPGAWLGAVLWALHPVEVESVAWISEMKNTESGLFFLLSILFFLRWLRARDLDERTGGGWNYVLSLLFAALAMASKSSTVILPVVLCLCAWWVEGRWHWRNLARVVLIFLLSIAASALSLWTQGLELATAPDPQWVRTWPERLVAAGDAVWFYLGKLLWPHPLIAIYPRWQIDAGRWVSYLPLLAVIIVLLILWLKQESWSRPWFFVFAYFLVALLPALGLVDNTIFRFSLVFDHFQYLASMGPLALAGAGLVRLADSVIPGKQQILYAGLLLIFGILTWQRTWAFESEETLWADTLTKDPESWAAHYNLGLALFKKGQADEAKIQFQEALAINPKYTEAHTNLGLALLQKGQGDEAKAQFQKALEINPNFAIAHVNLGTILIQKGQVDEAMAQFQKALEISPNYPEAHYNLGIILIQKGQVDEAITQFQKALENDPNLAPAHYYLGLALFQKGQADEAIAQFQKTLEITPNDDNAYNNLGLALSQKGLLAEAVSQYRKALEINPNSDSVQGNLGMALFQMGQKEEAMTHFQKAVEINPASDKAHNNLGNAHLMQGQVDEAIIQYQKALAIDPNFADAHRNLGVALLRKGQVDAAMAQFQEVVRLNPGDSVAQDILAKTQAMARQKQGRK